MKQPKVGVVMLSHDLKSLTFKSIKSVIKTLRHSRIRYKLILVDNGSRNGSYEYLVKKLPSNVCILKLDENYGFSAGSNIGILFCIKKFHPNYIFLINNDIFPITNDWLKILVEISKKYCDAVVSPILLYPDRTLQIKLSSRKLEENIFISKDLPLGCALIPVTHFRKVGLFDISLSPFYYEDSDMSLRFLKERIKLILTSEVKMIHKHSSTTSLFKHFTFYSRVKNAVMFLLRSGKKKALLLQIARNFFGIFVVPGDSRRFFFSLKPNVDFFKRFIYFFLAIKVALTFYKFPLIRFGNIQKVKVLFKKVVKYQYLYFLNNRV